MYQKGLGVEQDYSEALFWYKKAAGKENAAAQNQLGRMYETGLGVEQDYTKAVYWYRKAAGQKNVNALANLHLLPCNELSLESG